MSDSKRRRVSKSADVQPEKDWNYEATVAKVEAIVDRVESGELELARVFEEFALAVEYLRQCETFLSQREQQVSLLLETLEDGGFEF